MHRSFGSVHLTACYFPVHLILKEGGKTASDFLCTLFLWFACHKINHSKPVIQFPVSWSPTEYIFNLPVQHMFSGKGDFWHQDYFRAASKRSLWLFNIRMKKHAKNMQGCCSCSGHANDVAYFLFNISKCEANQVALLTLMWGGKKNVWMYIQFLLFRPVHPNHPVFVSRCSRCQFQLW